MSNMLQPSTVSTSDDAVQPDARRFSSRDYDVDVPLRAMATRLGVLVKAEARAELASLKRLNPDYPDKPAFYRLVADCVPRRFMGDGSLPLGAPGSETDMACRLATIASILALRPDRLRSWGLGRAMAEAGVSEQRFSMLLTSRGPVLRDLARRLARRLARAAEALPYLDLGRLILMDGLGEHDDEAEAVRIALAGEYQSAVRRKERAVAVASDAD
jgi:hypothetical protein